MYIEQIYKEANSKVTNSSVIYKIIYHNGGYSLKLYLNNSSYFKIGASLF